MPDRRLDGRSVDGRSVDGRRLGLDRFLVALAALGWIVTVGWLVMGLGDDAARRVVSDVGETALDLLAAALVLRAGLRIDVRRIRLGWIVVGIAMIVYAVGDGTWAWLDIAGGSTTSPSLADAAYVLYYPTIVAALFMFQRASTAKRDTLRLTIDSLIVVTAAGSWSGTRSSGPS